MFLSFAGAKKAVLEIESAYTGSKDPVTTAGELCKRLDVESKKVAGHVTKLWSGELIRLRGMQMILHFEVLSKQWHLMVPLTSWWDF